MNSQGHPGVIQDLIQIIANRLSRDPATIHADSHLVDDLGCDSLELVELIMDIEDHFGIDLPDKPMGDSFRSGTVRWFASMVTQALDKRAPDSRGTPQEPTSTAPVLAEWTQYESGPALAPGGRVYNPIGKSAAGHPTFHRLRDGMTCLQVPPGRFEPGARPPPGTTASSIEMPGFLLDREPVSVAAYARFLTIASPPDEALRDWIELPPEDGRQVHLPVMPYGRGWAPKPGCARLPMWMVSWYGANAYSLWVHGQDWRCYRDDGPTGRDAVLTSTSPPRGSYLVSEAEWEYASRGSDLRAYPWGDDPPTADRVCLARHHRGQRYQEAGDIPAAPTHQVLGAGPFGHHHLSGNVWNWCRDAFHPTMEPALGRAFDPERTVAPAWRSERGGSWLSPVELGVIGYRRGRSPLVRGRCLGFRCSHPLP